MILGAGLMSEDELDDTIAEMERIIADPETYEISFTVTQVWGRKPRNSLTLQRNASPDSILGPEGTPAEP